MAEVKKVLKAGRPNWANKLMLDQRETISNSDVVKITNQVQFKSTEFDAKEVAQVLQQSSQKRLNSK